MLRAGVFGTFSLVARVVVESRQCRSEGLKGPHIQFSRVVMQWRWQWRKGARVVLYANVILHGWRSEEEGCGHLVDGWRMRFLFKCSGEEWHHEVLIAIPFAIKKSNRDPERVSISQESSARDSWLSGNIEITKPILGRRDPSVHTRRDERGGVHKLHYFIMELHRGY
ncbi:hypothetical protein JTE90_001949 [Oedothorax gibbosus]|uniref:Uncharacterized protein n=1 Tax=Oedothorax gibbosus TaxID=931172 RepID=A0AAV6VVJ0_9ARAC|nr:hypothetical protein JTE90_001949 [Oedothorax gibbosus]